jgi:hypothetical protein
MRMTISTSTNISVLQWKLNEDLGKNLPSIANVEKSLARMLHEVLFVSYFMPFYCLVNPSTLKMVVIFSFKVLVSFHQIAERYILEDSIPAAQSRQFFLCFCGTTNFTQLKVHR